MKNKITFSSGTLKNEGNGYYTLVLFNSAGEQVYTSTENTNSASEIINKHNNIKIA